MDFQLLPFTHNNQQVPVDDFAKFQSHQTTDDNIVVTLGHGFVFVSYRSPLNSDFLNQICSSYLICDQATICIYTQRL